MKTGSSPIAKVCEIYVHKGKFYGVRTTQVGYAQIMTVGFGLASARCKVHDVDVWCA